ncbi:MAG: outer membrane protein assembly factor BamD [Mariprofundaceae bacterium]|nr:outer membrane protein assembly factor BamD [Mariprofundaceae bacterium]
MKYFSLCIMIMGLLSACAKTHDLASNSVKEDYQYAQGLIDSNNYARATIFLEKFSGKHAYSEYAIKASMLRIYAAYKDEEYILSETLAVRFLKQHPRHPNLAYVQYILAQSYIHESGASERDQTATQHAIDEIHQLLKKYPDSKYVSESRQSLQKMYNKKAKHELYVGKFYYDHERYVASTNRFKVVMNKYQTSPVIEEALYYLSASYMHLKLKQNAQEIIAVLKHNYPQSVWSEKAASL